MQQIQTTCYCVTLRKRVHIYPTQKSSYLPYAKRVHIFFNKQTYIYICVSKLFDFHRYFKIVYYIETSLTSRMIFLH